MTHELDVSCVDRFRIDVARCLGLQFDETKSGYLAEVLRQRLAATRQTQDDYLDRLEQDTPRDEIRALAQELTVSETYFFRNGDQFRAFSDIALPERMRAQAARRGLACSAKSSKLPTLGRPAHWPRRVRLWSTSSNARTGSSRRSATRSHMICGHPSGPSTASARHSSRTVPINSARHRRTTFIGCAPPRSGWGTSSTTCSSCHARGAPGSTVTV